MSHGDYKDLEEEFEVHFGNDQENADLEEILLAALCGHSQQLS